MNTYKYERYDECYGVVTSRDSKRVYLQLDNGESAIDYKVVNLKQGTRVICTVLKPAVDKLRTVVSICSTGDYAFA